MQDWNCFCVQKDKELHRLRLLRCSTKLHVVADLITVHPSDEYCFTTKDKLSKKKGEEVVIMQALISARYRRGIVFETGEKENGASSLLTAVNNESAPSIRR